jgi:uncharacterized protein YybS (DUF2232 family)
MRVFSVLYCQEMLQQIEASLRMEGKNVKPHVSVGCGLIHVLVGLKVQDTWIRFFAFNWFGPKNPSEFWLEVP